MDKVNVQFPPLLPQLFLLMAHSVVSAPLRVFERGTNIMETCVRQMFESSYANNEANHTTSDDTNV